jgi:hypothetical protein
MSTLDTPGEPNAADTEFDYEESQADENERARAAEYYAIFRDAVQAERADSLQSGVRKRHHEIILQKVYPELAFAKSAFEDAEQARNSTGTNWMNLMFAAYLRAYRAVEWYQAQLGAAIADTMVQPFAQYVKDGAPLPRDFFRPGVMTAFRDAILDETFEPLPISEELKTFFDTHRAMRNLLAHTLQDPSPVTTKPCVVDAIDLYNRVATQLDNRAVVLENIPKSPQ